MYKRQGSFGTVIAATNIGDALISTMNINTTSVVSVLLFAYFIGFIFRVAQGSGTVAGITSMGIMATIAPSVPDVYKRQPYCRPTSFPNTSHF